jgi:hypothetical protein
MTRSELIQYGYHGKNSIIPSSLILNIQALSADFLYAGMLISAQGSL